MEVLMELTALIELIPTLGFPIVLVIAMGWFIFKIYNQSVERENKLFGELTENRAINAKFAEIIAQYEIELGEIKTDVKDIKDVLIKQ
jgi:F0F1-type ATP synthase membrane subunit b/b'